MTRTSTRRRFVARGVSALGVAAVVRAPARASQFEVKAGSGNPADHPATIRSLQMWYAIEKESGGRIHAQYFPNGQLGGEVALLSQLRTGAIQFINIGAGALNAVVPAADIINVGFAFKDADEALRALDGPFGDYLRREIAAKGLHPIQRTWDSGMRQITSSTHPIRTVADLGGFRIRVVESRLVVDLFKALGASPVPLSVTEVYTALQTKIVDGQDAPLGSIQGYRYYEVQKYLSLTNHTWSCSFVIGNQDFWKSLPPDLQVIVERNMDKYGLLERRDTKIINASVADKLQRQGMALNTADHASFRARLHAYYDACATTFGPTAWGLFKNSLSGGLS